MSQAESSSIQSSTSLQDDWQTVRDPVERRRIQNRLAQRKFREKGRIQREEEDRRAENQKQAAASYVPPDPDDIDDADESGLPWGSLSMKHVIATGKAKEFNARNSSTHATAWAGGSSRLGLHLTYRYAFEHPAWSAWPSRIVPVVPSQREPVAAWSQAPG